MVNHFVSNQFLSLVFELEHHYKKLQRNVSKKNLHHFRVVYKKMDAFIRWICSVSSESNSVQINLWISKWQSINKLAGKIRELQIFLACGADTKIWKGDKKVKGALVNKIKAKINSFQLELDDFRVPPYVDVASLVKNSVDDKILSIIKSFLHNQYNCALNALSQNSSVLWHDARRLLKSNVLLIEITELDLNEKDRRIVDNWIEMTTLLGQWHDWHEFNEKIGQRFNLKGKNILTERLNFYEELILQKRLLLSTIKGSN
jgi:CHAD domain-containing protein